MEIKKIAVVSGKGGVGKSMISSSLCILFSQERDIAALDCDVDAPNLAVWLGEPNNWESIEKISVSEKPVIKENNSAGKECASKCKFNALEVENENLKLNPFLCEGCGACEIFCPQAVLGMKPVESGEIRKKTGKHGFPLYSGHLYPGETGSGKIVSKIKSLVDGFTVIDAPPGTGCPVIASLQDVDLVLLVTEPTPSAFSDLKRVLKVVNHFNIPWFGVLNKWDMNEKMSFKIEKWLGDRFLGKISYDKKIFKAVSSLIPVMETNLKAKKEIKNIYNNLKKWSDL